MQFATGVAATCRIRLQVDVEAAMRAITLMERRGKRGRDKGKGKGFGLEPHTRSMGIKPKG